MIFLLVIIYPITFTLDDIFCEGLAHRIITAKLINTN
jgi:hypothetical protein